MKASVQYNDYKGSAAADASDHIKLNEYLATHGVDIDRYKAIGIEFYAGERFFTFSIICEDKDSDENKAVKIDFEEKQTPEMMFKLFKRFNVILTWNKGGAEYQTWELEDAPVLTIDNRK